MAFVAKDTKGFQKSLGGDVFTVSWERAGDDEPATFGRFPLFLTPRRQGMQDQPIG